MKRDYFRPMKLIQVVRATVSRHLSVVLVAHSADLPGRPAIAPDMAVVEIPYSIRHK